MTEWLPNMVFNHLTLISVGYAHGNMWIFLSLSVPDITSKLRLCCPDI